MNTNREFMKLNFKKVGISYDEKFLYDLSKNIIDTKPGMDNLSKKYPEIDSSKLSKEEYDKLLEEQFDYNCNSIMYAVIYSKIKEWNPQLDLDRFLPKTISKILEDLPKEFYKNIEEWVNDEPFTDIVYKDITLNEILKKMQYEKCPDLIWKASFILHAFEDIARYANGTYEDKEDVLYWAFDQTHFIL